MPCCLTCFAMVLLLVTILHYSLEVVWCNEIHRIWAKTAQNVSLPCSLSPSPLPYVEINKIEPTTNYRAISDIIYFLLTSRKALNILSTRGNKVGGGEKRANPFVIMWYSYMPR